MIILCRIVVPEPEQNGWNPDRLTVVLQISEVSMKAITPSILLLAAALSPAQGKREGTAEKPFADGGQIRMELGVGDYDIVSSQSKQIQIEWVAVFGKEQDTTKANPASAESVTARVDKLFAQWNSSDLPGCSLGVSQNGVRVYDRGYGMANLELGVPITPASVFPAASISKQFTAMSILLLAQRGQLSLDDEVRKYIPDWADHDSRITIRHLLTHTSGLRDAFMLQGLAPPREDGSDPNNAILKILTRARGLNFAPGAEFQYNNGAYNLLGSIVKRVSGQSLRAFADANIFRPLGMTHTHFHDDPGMIVPNRVSGYHRDESGLHFASENGGIVGNAGLQTTVGDLLLWEQNFAEVRVGDRALVTAMQTPAIPTGWSDGSSYGYGLEIAQYRGLRTIGHGGGDRGIASYVVRYPEQGFAVALLCNLDNIGGNVTGLTQRVADIFLSDAFSTPPMSSGTPTPTSVTLSAEQLASKVGLYRDLVTESVGRIFLRDGKLMASEGVGEDESVELTPVSENRFVVLGTPIVAEFVPAAPGRPQEVRVTGDGPKPVVSQQVTNSFAPSSMELRAFRGEYTSAEVEGTYMLAARDSGLIIQIPGRTDIALQPIFSDGFAGAIVGVVKFSRDGGGAVTGFTAYSSGARGLRFDRVKR
jgi:CubicO group peptidase (beta-lactamase class C family)